jgi:hypothetical protein
MLSFDSFLTLVGGEPKVSHEGKTIATPRPRPGPTNDAKETFVRW